MFVLKGLGRLAWPAIVASILLFFCPQIYSQVTVYPLGGIANIQFFTATGAVCSSCAIYIYQAGTSTQVATYVDSTGTTVNTNPVLLNSAGRPASGGIWLTAANVKIVGCSSSTDGPNCAGADILFSVDQVPGNFGASSGSATSPFTSSSSNPATTGILRLASSDSGPCWRNAANSANLCWSKDSSDRLIWAGGSLFFPEIGAPTGVAASDLLWADNTAHRWKVSNNGGTAAQLVISGADINTSDQVTSTHLSAALPTAQGGTGVTALTSLSTTVNGTTCALTSTCTLPIESNLSMSVLTPSAPNLSPSPKLYLANAHTLERFYVSSGIAQGGCTTAPTVTVYDFTALSVLTSLSPGNGTTDTDSGALSIPMTAGHVFGFNQTSGGGGCSNNLSLTATYQ